MSELDDDKKAKLERLEPHRLAVAAFLADLDALQQKHGLHVTACSCCCGVNIVNDEGDELASEVGYDYYRPEVLAAQLGTYNSDDEFTVVAPVRSVGEGTE